MIDYKGRGKADCRNKRYSKNAILSKMKLKLMLSFCYWFYFVDVSVIKLLGSCLG